MADEELLAILRQGANTWNAWRAEHSSTVVNLSRADLHGADFTGARLHGADLSGAYLSRARLREADLRGADLRGACLYMADLSGADLQYATLVETDFTQATLTDCRVYGIAAWGLQLEGATQTNLSINARGRPTITVDDLEVAQFLYLMLHNQKIRRVIDTLTSKVVMILGRFTSERMAVLDALREQLRTHNYVPVLFDFDRPASQDILQTVTLLARMARFVIADITDPAMVRAELALLVRDLPSVAFQPLLQRDGKSFVEWETIKLYRNVLAIYRYGDTAELLAALPDAVIVPAEEKVSELRALRLADS